MNNSSSFAVNNEFLPIVPVCVISDNNAHYEVFFNFAMFYSSQT